MKRAPAHVATSLLASALSLTFLAGCASEDEIFGTSQHPSGSSFIVVGSQDYYSNEIIAEIYAQILESDGYEVRRRMRIGQREAYIPEIESGRIDVFPEYSGNLLQYWKPNTSAKKESEVYAQLRSALPGNLLVLEDAQASDQDAYAVTEDFARRHKLRTLRDLAKVEGLILAGNSELETRPYGPQGLAEIYGVSLSFTPIEDSGGPLTMKALRDGDVNLVKINTASPDIANNNLVILEDPENLLLASSLVPLISRDLPVRARRDLNAVQAILTTADLVELNARSIRSGKNAATIASEWIEENRGKLTEYQGEG